MQSIPLCETRRWKGRVPRLFSTERRTQYRMMTGKELPAVAGIYGPPEEEVPFPNAICGGVEEATEQMVALSVYIAIKKLEKYSMSEF